MRLKELKQLVEISYKEFKKSTDASPKQKIGNSVRMIHKKINEISQLVKYSSRLKNEVGINEEYGKTIGKHMTKISEKLNHLSNQFRNLSN